MKVIYGYIVFENGKVLGRRGKPLSWFENGRGYWISKLKWDGEWMTKALHTVVCEAFHGERPEGYEAGHIDGNSYNNHKDNLKWMTKTENRLQTYSDGRSAIGSKNANSKLTDEQVHTLCKRLEEGSYKSISALSRELGINRNTVNQIKHKRQWTHISFFYTF
jgi:hypothetical protein